jgi:uncharacterized repeat protein (TIGR01451 family)
MNTHPKLQLVIAALGFAAVTISISLFKSVIAAGPWYVAPGGNDSNSCLIPGEACATINGAIGKASSGDTIYVATGTYTSNSVDEVVLINMGVTLSGGWNTGFIAQDGMSIIDGQGVRRGITVSGLVAVTLERFTIQNGYDDAHQGGGGIRNNNGNLIVSGSQIINNLTSKSFYDTYGGGIFNGGTLYLTDSTVSGNVADSSGGGIYNSGTLTINNSSISGNTAGPESLYANTGGGGIYNSSGTLVLNNSTVSQNKILGSYYGSSINHSWGSLIVNNSTISDNSNGAGIYINNASSVSLSSSTISHNQGHGLEINGTWGVTLRNTILANNGGLPGSDCHIMTVGGINSLGYNLIQKNSNCSLTGNDLVNIDPILGLLQTNDGSTPTHALTPGSPAVDAGNPAGCTDNLGNLLITDQRGKPRFDRCDIGAFELQFLEYSTKVADRQSAYRGETITYTITLANPGMEEISDVQLADDLPDDLNYVNGSLAASTGQATYQDRQIAWAGTLSAQERVSVTFSATVNQLGPFLQPITNTAEIHFGAERFLRNAIVRINPHLIFCPLIRKPCPSPYADDFSNPSSGWPVGDVTNYRTEYLGGEYRILVRPTDWMVGARPDFQAADYTATVDVRNPGGLMGYYGIVFGIAADWSSFYVFGILSNGNFAVFRYDAGSWVLLYQEYSSAIYQGNATNRIKVVRNGPHIDGYVNNNYLTMLQDSTYTGSRYIGLLVMSSNKPNVDIRFDNFTVYPLNCGELVSTLNTKIEWPASLDQRFSNIFSGEIGAFKPRR